MRKTDRKCLKVTVLPSKYQVEETELSISLRELQGGFPLPYSRSCASVWQLLMRSLCELLYPIDLMGNLASKKAVDSSGVTKEPSLREQEVAQHTGRAVLPAMWGDKVKMSAT